MSTTAYSNTILAVTAHLSDLFSFTKEGKICTNGHIYHHNDFICCPKDGGLLKDHILKLPTEKYGKYLSDNFLNVKYSDKVSEELFTKQSIGVIPHLVCTRSECGYECSHDLGFGLILASGSDYHRDVGNREPNQFKMSEIDSAKGTVAFSARMVGLESTDIKLYSQIYWSY